MRIAVVAILVGGCFGATTPPPRATAPWGTPAPYDLIATDPAGAWAVVCQARADTDHDGAVATYWGMHGDANGDEMSAFVVDARGRETPIDDLLAAAPTGRWLAVTIAKAPVLIDTRTWRRTPMRGELPHFDLGKGMRRWSFDRSGEHLLYFRDDHPIVRTLATGAEAALPVAWSAAWTSDGAWVQLEELAGDTNHDGVVHGPNHTPAESGPWNNCGRHFAWGGIGSLRLSPDTDADRLATLVQAGDELRHRAWRVADGKLVDADRPLDRGTVVVRAPDGALAIVDVDTGKRVPLEPATCGAELHESYGRGLLYTCRLDGADVAVHWYRDGVRAELVHRADGNAVQIYAKGRAANVSYGSDDASAQLVVDLATGATLQVGDGYLAWGDDRRALLVRVTGRTRRPKYVEHAALELRWFDGRAQALPPADDPYPALASSRYLVYAKIRVDLDTGASDRIAAQPIAIRDDGAILVDGGAPTKVPPDLADLRLLRLGPLLWARQ